MICMDSLVLIFLTMGSVISLFDEGYLEEDELHRRTSWRILLDLKFCYGDIEGWSS